MKVIQYVWKGQKVGWHEITGTIPRVGTVVVIGKGRKFPYFMWKIVGIKSTGINPVDNKEYYLAKIEGV